MPLACFLLCVRRLFIFQVAFPYNRQRSTGILFVAVILHPDFNRRPPLGFAVGVGIAQGIGTAAVFLLVETLALADFNHARTAAAFAPVEVPIHQAGVFFSSTAAAIINLVHVFPAGNAEAAGEHGKAVFVGILGSFFKAHVETHGAAFAALRFPFHAFGARKPVVGVVVAVDEGDVVFFGKGDVFVFAQLVFAPRVDVGVVEEDGVVDFGGEQRFHHFAGTGGAAGMEQDFFVAVRRDEFGALERGCGHLGINDCEVIPVFAGALKGGAFVGR